MTTLGEISLCFNLFLAVVKNPHGQDADELELRLAEVSLNLKQVTICLEHQKRFNFCKARMFSITKTKKVLDKYFIITSIKKAYQIMQTIFSPFYRLRWNSLVRCAAKISIFKSSGSLPV
jgi:hypothetical protein